MSYVINRYVPKFDGLPYGGEIGLPWIFPRARDAIRIARKLAKRHHPVAYSVEEYSESYGRDDTLPVWWSENHPRRCHDTVRPGEWFICAHCGNEILPGDEVYSDGMDSFCSVCCMYRDADEASWGLGGTCTSS
jgi:hypothetical protein